MEKPFDYIKSWRHDVLMLLSIAAILCIFSDDPDGAVTKSFIISKCIGLALIPTIAILYRRWFGNAENV